MAGEFSKNCLGVTKSIIRTSVNHQSVPKSGKKTKTNN